MKQADKNKEQNYRQLIDRSIGDIFRDALTISSQDPALARFLLQTGLRQKRAAEVRHKWQRQGIPVPPLMIFSVTHQCNLHCQGCYAQAQHRNRSRELGAARFREILSEAGELGIGITLLAGGEPLTRPEFLEIAAVFPEMIFAIFTNGLLFDEGIIRQFKTNKNLVPVISIEGDAATTDGRRGVGTYQQIRRTLQCLQANRIFYGVSLTATRNNCRTITDTAFVTDLLGQGCKLFFYVEYVPVKENTTAWVLGEAQRTELLQATRTLRSKYPALFIAFPGDEEQFGGCLAAGRGFIHISPDGSLEPCPFSPFSDTNLERTSLKEALQSELLATIRNNHGLLQETAGGCALWEHREWVEGLAQSPYSSAKKLQHIVEEQ
jgi:MoaA/NifB/PqqE/SkfB family radical SAM enzyme